MGPQQNIHHNFLTTKANPRYKVNHDSSFYHFTYLSGSGWAVAIAASDMAIDALWQPISGYHMSVDTLTKLKEVVTSHNIPFVLAQHIDQEINVARGVQQRQQAQEAADRKVKEEGEKLQAAEETKKEKEATQKRQMLNRLALYHIRWIMSRYHLDDSQFSGRTKDVLLRETFHSLRKLCNYIKDGCIEFQWREFENGHFPDEAESPVEIVTVHHEEAKKHIGLHFPFARVTL